MQSPTFDFKEYKRFLEELKSKVQLDALNDKLIKFLPFDKIQFNNEFNSWKKDYKQKNQELTKFGKDWLTVLALNGNRKVDDDHEKFIKIKLREEDDKSPEQSIVKTEKKWR